MSRRNPLDAVIRVTGEREREAGRLLAERRAHLEQQEQRLEELLTYRRQYLERFRTAGGEGIPMGQLNEYRIFLSRLDQALEQQRRAVERSRTAFHRSQEQWLECRRERKAVDKLADRRAAQARRRQRRREQAETDEFAGRRGPGREMA